MSRLRNPEQTRQRLVEAAFAEIHESGYNAASLDTILESAGVTKGALYHHFGSKKALAQAVISGVVRGMVVDAWMAPLLEEGKVIDGIQSCLSHQMDSITPEMVMRGCPLNNLAQELSAVDDDFREQIDEIYAHWRQSLADVVQQGVDSGEIRGDVDASDVATFLVAAMAGTAGFTKSSRDLEVGRASFRVINNYLDTLRAEAE